MARAAETRATSNALKGAAKPGPKPALSVEKVAQAAIRIADRNGIASLSMERVARQVHVSTMALYRYFETKDQLIEAMIGAAGGPAPDLNGPAREWRSRLAEWTRRCTAIYTGHPWFAEATARRRIMGPHELLWLEAALAILRDAGLPHHDQWRAFLVLIGHVRSSAEFSFAGKRGVSARQWAQATGNVLREAPGRYPALAAVIASGAFDDRFSDGAGFGLECILDGIESLVRKRRSKDQR